MSEVELQDLAFLYLTDALEPDERRDVEARLDRGDATMHEALDQAAEVYATLPRALEPRPPRPELEAELVARARRSIEPPRRLARAAPWLALAAGITLLAAGALSASRYVKDTRARVAGLEAKLHAASDRATTLSERIDALGAQARDTRRRLATSETARREAEAALADRRLALLSGVGAEVARAESAAEAERVAMREEIAALEAALSDALELRAELLADRGRERSAAQSATERLVGLERALQDSRRALALVRAPDVGIVDLFADDTRSASSASVFWAAALRHCYLHANGLPPLEPAQRYALWVEYEGGVIAHVSDFEVDARGEAEFFSDLPQHTGEIVRTFVSQERRGETGRAPQRPARPSRPA